MTELKLAPFGARVLLERAVATKVGSILLPGNAAKRHASLKCKVLAVGPACDGTIKVGQTVLIGSHCGAWLDADGNTLAPDEGADKGLFYIVMDEDILAEVRA